MPLSREDIMASGRLHSRSVISVPSDDQLRVDVASSTPFTHVLSHLSHLFGHTRIHFPVKGVDGGVLHRTYRALR